MERAGRPFHDTGGRGRTDTPVKERDFESRASANSATPANHYGGGNRTRTGDKGVADPCLTTWLCRQILERKTRFELATSTLARWRSTTELLPQKAGVPGFEPGHDGIKTRCLTAWLYPINKRWGGRGELNPRVPESQSGALTTSPRPPSYNF